MAELVAEECGDVVELRAVHGEREFAAEFLLREDGEFCGERGGGGFCGGGGEIRGHCWEKFARLLLLTGKAGFQPAAA